MQIGWRYGFFTVSSNALAVLNLTASTVNLIYIVDTCINFHGKFLVSSLFSVFFPVGIFDLQSDNFLDEENNIE